MNLWLVDKKAFDAVYCLQDWKSNFTENIGSMQDTGVVTYNIFVVVFQGPSGRVEQAGTSTSFVTGE